MTSLSMVLVQSGTAALPGEKRTTITRRADLNPVEPRLQLASWNLPRAIHGYRSSPSCRPFGP